MSVTTSHTHDFEVVLREPGSAMFQDPALAEDNPERITIEELRAKVAIPAELEDARMDLLVVRGRDGRLYQAAWVLDLVPFDPLERAREVGDIGVKTCALCEAQFPTHAAADPYAVNGDMRRHLLFAHGRLVGE